VADIDGTTGSNLKVLDLAKLRESVALIHELDTSRFDTIMGGRGLREAFRVPDSMIGGEPSRAERMNHFFGYTVHEMPIAPRRPVLQISPEFEHCSPEFRAVWNAWALDRFGTEEVCYLVNSRAMAELMRANFDRMEREFICKGVVQLGNYT
jgi:hypothetical protein